MLTHSHVKSTSHALIYTASNLRESRCTTGLRSTKKTFLKTNIPKCEYEKSFVFRGATLWNTLLDDIKSLRTLNAFKTWTKSELLLGNINFPE